MVSSLGPADAPGNRRGVSWTLPAMPVLLRRLILRLTSLGLDKDPDRFIESSMARMAADGAALLGEPQYAETFSLALSESFRQGIRAANQEASLYRRRWGFNLKDITSHVSLWHGELDLNVPVSVARYLADLCLSCSEYCRKPCVKSHSRDDNIYAHRCDFGILCVSVSR
jgi:hypothetical protein